jgi:hypothetical protein
MTAVRNVRPLLLGLAAVAAVTLAGCSSPSAGSAGFSPSASGQTTYAPTAAASGQTTYAPTAAASGHTTYAPTAALSGPAEQQAATQAGVAAARFYSVYFAQQFSTVWDLLSPVAKHQVSQQVWVQVHNACHPAVSGKDRVVKSVTVFGDTAIVTAVVAGSPGLGATRDVFDNVGGQWLAMPPDLNIYAGRSVAADVAAARAEGLCTGWKAF